MNKIASYLAVVTLFFLSTGCSLFSKKEDEGPIKIIRFAIDNNGYQVHGQINDLEKAKTIVIFFHGSGVQDRWATMPAEATYTGKPESIFKPIVDELNKNDIATCVFDKRGFREQGKTNFEDVLRTMSFENFKKDAKAVVKFILEQEKYKNIVLIGHSEGTVTASEIIFDLKTKKNKISGLILMGVLAENLKTALQTQLTDIVALNVFAMFDKNNDGKIYPEEIPAQNKLGLPLELIDSEKKGYFVRSELLKVLNYQAIELFNQIDVADDSMLIAGKPAKWYKDFFNRKTLLERASEYNISTLIVHGELDQNVLFKLNAMPLVNKMRQAGRKVSLKSYPYYGHGFSPEKESIPTLGPVQTNVIADIIKFIKWSK